MKRTGVVEVACPRDGINDLLQFDEAKGRYAVERLGEVSPIELRDAFDEVIVPGRDDDEVRLVILAVHKG